MMLQGLHGTSARGGWKQTRPRFLSLHLPTVTSVKDVTASSELRYIFLEAHLHTKKTSNWNPQKILIFE